MYWVKSSLSPIIPNKLSVDEKRLVQDGHDHNFNIACAIGINAGDELVSPQDRWMVDD